MPVDEAELADEQRRLRELRTVVDLAASVIAQGHLGRGEAERLVAAARERALRLFPDKAATFDLILAPRFARLVAEFGGGPGPAAARVLPFRRAGAA